MEMTDLKLELLWIHREIGFFFQLLLRLWPHLPAGGLDPRTRVDGFGSERVGVVRGAGQRKGQGQQR